MAKAESDILELLKEKPEGLEFFEIYQHLDQDSGLVSERGVRNLLNKMVKENQLVKHKQFQKRSGRGAPGYLYFHPDALPQQLNIFSCIPGVEKADIISRTDIVDKYLLDLEPEEKERQKDSLSLLENIANGHLKSESYAQAIIQVAPELANKNPIDLIIELTQWILEDIRATGNELKDAWTKGDQTKVHKLGPKLDSKLGWARNFRNRWRFDRSTKDFKGILDLPARARDIYRDNKPIGRFDTQEARKVLEKRIIGDKLIEQKELLNIDCITTVSGTDASVADIFLTHTSGSFIPPEPVVITNSAAAMIIERPNSIPKKYQDFDIFPEKLKDYDDYQAAINGLILSPVLMRNFSGGSGDNYFERSKPVAMDLRQYCQDYNVATKHANWRSLDDPHDSERKIPGIIFRDGRIFPVAHNVNPYENDTLYGKIIRNQIEKFSEVIYNTIAKPVGKIIYAGAVKNPELSWLSPIIFWYLYFHKIKVKGKQVINNSDSIYNAPFSDTTVSHLLFLGVAKTVENFGENTLFSTFQVIRHFADIAFSATKFPFVINNEDDETKKINENSIEDWQEYFKQRLNEQSKNDEEVILELSDYDPFIYACARVGTLMLYAAPVSSYRTLANNENGGDGHFLVPRLEIAIEFQDNYDIDYQSYHSKYKEDLEKMLSWLTSEHWVRDIHHTQSGYDSTTNSSSFPILIPEVTQLADEVARFSRNCLSQEIHDEIRDLIAELNKRLSKRS